MDVPDPQSFIDNTVVDAIGLEEWRAAIRFALNPPMVQSVQTTTQTLTTGTGAKLLLDAVDYDTDSMFDAASGTLICQTEGFYDLKAASTWAGTSSVGYRETVIKINGAERAHGRINASASGGTYGVFASCIAYLEAGDNVAVWGAQNSGSSVATFTGTGLIYLNARWVGNP